jgi:hypothetical protein
MSPMGPRPLTDALDLAIQGAMKIERDSVHFRILQALCEMPRPVRGIALPMLERRFGNVRAVKELAAAGLVRERRWHIGAGGVWIPTEAGERLYEELAGPQAAEQAAQ